ncbi:MAG: conjugal transfer protein TraF [Rhodospirillaceae bacterium]|nr:conjugal transfer protein TraF [Rhodospirillaceae bacterium]MDE0256704.1 conjugal transfer protein TraF [Rhodospirillaceae bacterium]MDE0379680.1 conjugal transfer protein TraF [Rhodospirillales bacterium]
MARASTYAVAAGIVWMVAVAFAAPAATAGEWRSWCGPGPGSSPGSGPGSSPGRAPDYRPSLGWHFYCDRHDRSQDHAAPQAPPPAVDDRRTATERILELRRALEEARAEAILDPTPAKVTAYLRLQQETLQRAAAFSDAFRRTVWATPALDYTLRRPVGALAKQVWSDRRRDARDRALARLGERYGLIYLGLAGCAGCRVFGPLLRAFAKRHDLDVLAVSLDGAALEGWPEAVADNGRAARLGLGNAPVPALVLFDTQTKRILPVGFGVMAEDQMAERIFALTALEPGSDY